MLHATSVIQLVEIERNNRVSRNDDNAQEEKNYHEMTSFAVIHHRETMAEMIEEAMQRRGQRHRDIGSVVRFL